MNSSDMVCSEIPGTVVGDTHAAQLNGTYTASSDSYSASSDTHAASLTGALSTTIDQSAGQNAETGTATLGMFKTSAATGLDVVLCSKTVTTNSNTKHVIVTVAWIFGGAGQPGTLKIKRGANTLVSTGNAGALTQSAVVDDTGFGVGSTQYDAVYNDSTGTNKYHALITAQVIDDNHAASLTGAYTASTHSYSASSDTHSAVLTGSKGTCTL